MVNPMNHSSQRCVPTDAFLNDELQHTIDFQCPTCGHIQSFLWGKVYLNYVVCDGTEQLVAYPMRETREEELQKRWKENRKNRQRVVTAPEPPPSGTTSTPHRGTLCLPIEDYEDNLYHKVKFRCPECKETKSFHWQEVNGSYVICNGITLLQYSYGIVYRKELEK